ncbi:hypothetical protein DAEQUDRAFT_3182 [Daedalea quercina L-15889]|uniref:Uncharacterized protein n=1 Tax=Daedalea quercina L-15889 TaxID=1314783 RepID=A0A165UC78_9APHY|nr:hypothetical protein DAEQUDRAFT_3182 [Daedalea quercina L-15889]
MHASLSLQSLSLIASPSHNVEADACTSPDKDVLEGHTTLRDVYAIVGVRLSQGQLPLPLHSPESLRAASTSSACTGSGRSCLLVQRTFRQHTHCRLLHYALLILLRTIRSPYAMSSTGSLSFLTPFRSTLFFNIIVQSHFLASSLNLFAVSQHHLPLLFPVSNRLLSFLPSPFPSVSSMLHHIPPSLPTTVVSSPHEPEGPLIVTRIPYCPTLRSSIPINPIIIRPHLTPPSFQTACKAVRILQ